VVVRSAAIMGVFYHFVPLDDEMAALLDEMGAAVSDWHGRSRNPTPAEVRKACGTLPGYKTHFNVKPKPHWQAVIDGVAGRDATILNMDSFKEAEDKPHTIWFEKGSPALILEITKRLSKGCGPLVVMPASGDVPIAVTPDVSVQELVRKW
jgi:hypothetical protein